MADDSSSYVLPALPRCIARAIGCALGFSALALSPTPVSASENDADRGLYLRLGAGVQWPQTERLRDQDCASTTPPALFGCGSGEDGQPLGALGSFRQSPTLDAALGYRWTSWLRTEALVNWSPQLDWQGQANFLGAGSNQPVTATGRSLAGFGVVLVDAPEVIGVRPYLGAGLGAASIAIADITFGFPAKGPSAETVVKGGTSQSLATLLTAGVAIPLSDRLALDLSYRWMDLGQLKTPKGTAIITRPQRRARLGIGGTQVDLKTQAVIGSLRFRF
jgi:opacity protein-like surface antigen